MPNHITNLLTVIGDPDEVARFVKAARGRPPKTGDDEDSSTNADLGLKKRPIEPFCFHSLVPLPEAYSRNRYGDSAADSG